MEMNDIVDMLKENKNVTDIVLEREFETSEKDGWEVNKPNGYVKLSFRLYSPTKEG